MAQDFLRNAGVHAVTEEQRRAAMPEVVKSDPRQASVFENATEAPLRDVVRVERLPIRLAEDQIIRRVCLAQGTPMHGLLCLDPFQFADKNLRHRHRPTRSRRLHVRKGFLLRYSGARRSPRHTFLALLHG